ncbi:MAG: LamG domain-containing protein [Akkermansiaceae bacterium]
MKKTIITTTLLCAASFGANAASIHTGLVNYWSFDGNGEDSASDYAEGASTIEDDMTAGGTAGAASLAAGGLFGGAVDFERTVGVDGRFAAAESVDVNFNAENLTISLWVNFDDNGTRWQGILGKGEGADYRLSAYNRTDNAGYAGGTGDIDSGANVRDGSWHHIVATTTEGGDTQLFVDGVLGGTNTAGASIVDDGNLNSGEFWIGNNPDNTTTDRMWDGLIDDVAQYNRVLSATEVDEIYQAGLLGTSLGAIPEPSSSLLLGLGGIAIVLRRRK